MDNKKRSLVKSIIWRLIGVAYLWIISFIFTGSMPISTAITFVHHSMFLVVYWLHERLWLRSPSFAMKGWVKGFTYEIIIAIPIMLMINFFFTQSWASALGISISYTVSKVGLYIIFEALWNKPIIYLDMVGDLFHAGHLNIIREAATRGKVVVGVVTNAAAFEYKRRPIINLEQRYEIIKNIKGVWKVMIQDDLDVSVINNMKKVGADFFIHGTDWRGSKQKERRAFLIRMGVKIIEVPYTKGISSTKIIKKCFQASSSQP